MHRPASASPREGPITHFFFDAEGTLWVPRPGRSFEEFWTDPDPRRGLEIFEPTPGLEETLDALQAEGYRLVVVSRHDVKVLPALLALFGLTERFDDVLVNGHKGARVVQWLRAHGLRRSNAIMVGDLPELDIVPLETFGVRAVLLDRPYNQGADAVRIHDMRDLVGIVRFANRDLVPFEGAERAAKEAGTWTGLAPLRP